MGHIFRITLLVMLLSAYSFAGDAPRNFVSQVTASSPMLSSGGLQPNLSMPQASNSQSGYLFSTDWTTFNNKVSGPAGSSSYIQYNDTVFGGDSNFTWDKTNLIFKAGVLGFDPTFISDWVGDVAPTILKRGNASTGALQIATEDSTGNTSKIVLTTGKIISGDLSVGGIEIVGGPNYGTGNAGAVTLNGGYQNTLNHSGASLQVGGATPTGDGRIQTSGGIDLSGYKLSSVATPTISTDAATKGYVDSNITSYTFSSPLVNTSGTISIPVATSSVNGYLSSANWSTFNGKQNALTIGNLSAAGTDGISVTSGTGSVIGSGTSLAQHVGDSTHNGYLSSTDWSTFNSKQSTLSFTAPIVNTAGTVAMAAATSSVNGYLTSTDWSTFNGKLSSLAIACFRDQKTAGTDGGTFTSGSFQTRTITNLDDNGTGITLNGSNQLLIPNGTYVILAYLPAFNIPNRHIGRLQDVDTPATLLNGQNNSSEGAGPFTFATLMGFFTISGGTKTVEVQHRAQTTVTTIGFGRSVASTLGANFDIYTQGCIIKLL